VLKADVNRKSFVISTTDNIVEVFAPAKINLYLHIVDRRNDGYHLLDSLVAFAGIGDHLILHSSDELSLKIDGPNANALKISNNIVLKTANAFAKSFGISAKVAITLTKNLPVAAGIGGGSADSAATLRGLCHLWKLSVNEIELARIGLSIGTDLPVCLAGIPTQVSGIGEILTPASHLPTAWIVLVNTGIKLSTSEVFKINSKTFSKPSPLIESPIDAATLAKALNRRRNDLTESALQLSPIINDVLNAIAASDNCLLTRMSGSGATCFGIFANQKTAEIAANQIAINHVSWWIAVAPLL
jgi:4-diphosphocytidyl-2-C-methyl-D-erythritol kinase